MIAMRGVTIRQGTFVLENVNLTIETGEYCVMSGPTGCGKTTLMESVLGLRPLQQGRIEVDGRDVTSLSPAARNIGYVPQDLGLFPTMRIDRQIEFPLRVRGRPKQACRERSQELAARLGIERLLRRYPGDLSGGERQRVAMARALAFQPRLLCLDEPLSSLDSGTRTQLVGLLGDIFEKERITIWHITHESKDASGLATKQIEFVSGAPVVTRVSGIKSTHQVPS